MDNSIYKQCTECGQTKHILEFSKSYPNRCKACVAEHTRMVRERAKQEQNRFRNTESRAEMLKNEIDWEQRRYEIAKAVMQGRLSNQYGDVLIGERDFEGIAVSSIELADALIAELKKGDVK